MELNKGWEKETAGKNVCGQMGVGHSGFRDSGFSVPGSIPAGLAKMVTVTYAPLNPSREG